MFWLTSSTSPSVRPSSPDASKHPVAKKSVVSCLNENLPIALMPILMKCFEQLVKPYITASLPASHDPYQFAYCANRFTEDAISTTLHSVITHLDQKDTEGRFLYFDFSSAFKTIINQRLVEKLLLPRPEHRHMSLDLGLSDGETSVCPCRK